MTDKKNDAQTDPSLLSSISAKVVELLSVLHLFMGEIGRSAASGFDRLLRRVEYLFILYLWVSIGVLFVVIGVFDLLIDSAGIPRGVVLSVGGGFIFLVSIILLQAAKIHQGGK